MPKKMNKKAKKPNRKTNNINKNTQNVKVIINTKLKSNRKQTKPKGDRNTDIKGYLPYPQQYIPQYIPPSTIKPEVIEKVKPKPVLTTSYARDYIDISPVAPIGSPPSLTPITKTRGRPKGSKNKPVIYARPISSPYRLRSSTPEPETLKIYP